MTTDERASSAVRPGASRSAGMTVSARGGTSPATRGTRRTVLKAGALVALLAAAMPEVLRAAGRQPVAAARGRAPLGGGRVVTVPSTPETVRLGVFNSSLPPIVEIESGDTVVYPDT